LIAKHSYEERRPGDSRSRGDSRVVEPASSIRPVFRAGKSSSLGKLGGDRKRRFRKGAIVMTVLNTSKAILKEALKLPNDGFSRVFSATASLLSVEQIKELSASAGGKLKTTLLAVLSAGLSAELPDSRDSTPQTGLAPYGPHKVYRFFVPAGKGTVVSQVRGLLTDEEVRSLTNEFDLNSCLKGISELVHFRDSNNKARNRNSAVPRAKTTQEEDFEATGHTFADDRVAVLFCARLVNKARGLGLDLDKGPDHWKSRQSDKFKQLSEAEREILKQLRVGVIRTCSGVLSIVDGRLRAYSHGVFSDPYGWAFGSAPLPESK
jgi:hypothetical protein